MWHTDMETQREITLLGQILRWSLHDNDIASLMQTKANTLLHGSSLSHVMFDYATTVRV